MSDVVTANLQFIVNEMQCYKIHCISCSG